MSTRMIGGQNSWFGAGTIAYRAILIGVIHHSNSAHATVLSGLVGPRTEYS
jgi:hypothetical protein